jgi:hypothetical protein
MADVTQTQVIPAPFIEAAGKTYLSDLASAVGGYKEADLSKIYGPQFVAGLDPLQLEAIKQQTAGIGAYKPYLEAAAAATGPEAYKAYMSPYQQDVIQQTLQEYDIQAQKGLPGIGARAAQMGAFGGARQGVQEAEYGSQSARNRAALQAQMLQQGFQQAQQAAAQQYGQQMGLATGVQSMLGKDVAGLSTLGAGVQAQKQAELLAEQQKLQAQLMQPITAAETYGGGVASMIAGYPGKSITEAVNRPGPSPVSTALGIGSTLAGIYGALR